MDRLKVSVVVPVYNVEPYLDRCVESIVNQTYKNLEIILVDDGSPDGCPALCDEWAKKDARIRVIHKQNAGAGMARNTGIEQATGEYVFFFDADDYVDLTTVEKCVESAVENGSDVVLYGRCDAYESGEVTQITVSAPKLVFQENEVNTELLPGLFVYRWGIGVSACSRMHRLDLIKQHNKRFVSEREYMSEDAYFTVEYFANVSVASIVPECFYYYYRRSGSFSRIYDSSRQALNDVFYREITKLVKQKQLPEVVLQHVTVRYHMYALGIMKQLMASSWSNKEKRKELRKFFKNRVLRDSLTSKTIHLDKKLSRVFWRVFQMRMFVVCYILLKCKA